MSRFLDRRLPPVDLHTHIAPDVTPAQLAQLAPSVVFAVTRSLEEAALVRHRTDPGVIWGCGAHPGVASALDGFDEDRFVRLLEHFAFVGEVGLDARGSLERQRRVLDGILAACSRTPVIVSLHSSGRAEEVVEMLEKHAIRGPVLHWFTGAADLVDRAAQVGAFFSVNSSAKRDLLATLPPERVLTETDFPSTKRTGSLLPGDVNKVEDALSALWGIEHEAVRRRIWRNLRDLVAASGTLNRLPTAMARKLIAA